MAHRNVSGQKGFTIIELLVATAVFAVVLVVITVAVLQISRVYYKGVTEANTQNTTRSIIDTISQNIQFGGGGVVTTPASPGSPAAFCIGNQRFVYDLGKQVVDGTPVVAKHQTYHALVTDTYGGCSNATTQPLDVAAVTGRELINANMRLSKLSVTLFGTNQYRVTVRIVYGHDDVLKNVSTPATTVCDNVSAGTQFCSVSELSTIVTKRVQ